jgi:hypothetical protein
MAVKVRKIAASFFMILLCGALLHGQSLYELAQKEKARRAKLKGKTSRVITNADLRSSSRTASVTTRSTPSESKAQPRKAASSSQSSNTGPVQSQSDRERQQRRAAAPAQPPEQRDPAPTNRPRRLNDTSGSGSYATEVLSNTRLVNRPELALKKPDGQYAEIKISGILDLSLAVQNGSGDDIAIYARPSGGEDVRQGGQEEGGISAAATYGMVEGIWYGVFAMNKQGEWIALGKGTGAKSPESFDLGSLAATDKIRIIFRTSANADLPYNRIRNTPQEITFGIDAAAVLH